MRTVNDTKHYFSSVSKSSYFSNNVKQKIPLYRNGSNIKKIIERDKLDTLNTHIHVRLLFWASIGTLITNGMVTTLL